MTILFATVAALQSRLKLDAVEDAEEAFNIIADAHEAGTSDKYGAKPEKSEDFQDEAAIDCEHTEAIMLLPKNSLRKLYLSEYEAARQAKTTEDALRSVEQKKPRVLRRDDRIRRARAAHKAALSGPETTAPDQSN